MATRGLDTGIKPLLNEMCRKHIHCYVSGRLLYVPFNGTREYRLGGSALAQCFGQLGDEAPMMDDPDLFVKAFNATQRLIESKSGLLSSAAFKLVQVSVCQGKKQVCYISSRQRFDTGCNLGELLSSGHDISDGGLVTCLLEMAFAGNCGLEVTLPASFSGWFLFEMFEFATIVVIAT